MTTGHSADERLLTPYRVMRRISPPEHPWSGLLVRAGDDALVLVPSEEVGETWPGWGAAPGGHILTPIDVVRRPDGHDVALPPCPHRLADVVARRRADERPFDAGEAVTVAVSILRGVGEIRSLDPSATGEWWITDDGMPVLAAGATSTRSGAQEGADILRAMLPCDPSVDAVLEDACVALETTETGSRALVDVESRLFACAEPQALATAPLSPRRARTVDTPFLAADDVVEPRRGFFERLAHHVDDDLAEVVSGAAAAAWRGFTRPGRQDRRARARGRPLLVGAAIAGVVVAGGLLWPGDDDPRPAEAAPIAATPGATGMPAEAATQETNDAAGASPDVDVDDLAAVASELLTRRAACADDPVCLADVVEDPSTVHRGGVVDLDASRRTVTLLDEFGGAAVLRAEGNDAAESPAQFVVIVVRDGTWLIRDVHDVADQP